MGQDTRSIFQYLKEEGYGFLIDGFHVKGQVIDSRGVAAWGYGGQTLQRGDWINGKPSPNPADQVNAWKKQTVFAEHELPGTARHDPRLSIEERYHTRDEYLRRLKTAAEALVRDRYLLADDVQNVMSRGEAQWDLLMARRPSANVARSSK